MHIYGTHIHKTFPLVRSFQCIALYIEFLFFFFLPLALEVLESEDCLVEIFLKIRVNQEYFCFKQVESFSKTLIWASVIKSFTVLLSVHCEDEIC